MLVLLAWLILGTLVGLLVMFVAGRLLGARRGWVALLVSGIIGWTAAVIVAGLVTDWEGSTFAMAAIAVVLGTLFTMSVAILIDLVAPVGSLATGEAAGLVTITNPVAGVRSKVDPLRRYREVIAIARRNGVSARAASRPELPVGVRRTLEEAGGHLRQARPGRLDAPRRTASRVVRGTEQAAQRRGTSAGVGDASARHRGTRATSRGRLRDVRLGALGERLDRPGVPGTAHQRRRGRREGPATESRRGDDPRQPSRDAARAAHRAAHAARGHDAPCRSRRRLPRRRARGTRLHHRTRQRQGTRDGGGAHRRPPAADGVRGAVGRTDPRRGVRAGAEHRPGRRARRVRSRRTDRSPRRVVHAPDLRRRRVPRRSAPGQHPRRSRRRDRADRPGIGRAAGAGTSHARSWR